MQTPEPVDLERTSRLFERLKLRLATLQGQARELQARRARLSREISLAKARIALAPEAMEAFNYLQEKAHARAVGQFEGLLSAFVADVIPEAGHIRLELGTERGAPSLDILLDNGGDLENILDGNGGGLTNVVVTGLGFSALSRTANRQLMVLDEPDCWLKAKYVPAFTQVIAEVANPQEQSDGTRSPGCQTLMISHNDVNLMDDGAHLQDLRVEREVEAFARRLGVRVEHQGEACGCAHVVWVDRGLSKRGHLEVRYRASGGEEEQNALTKGFPYVESISGARAWEDEDQPGIRWVEVSNLRRHVKTRIELSPGLNVLTGDINGGKSTLYFTALRALAYGETDDTMIRHGADSAIIRVGLEGNIVLEVERKRKGAPKVMYRRFENGVLMNEGRQETRGGVPAFIAEALKIARVDDLDIQLRSQKQPIFLLNEPAARRAQLLSVGREAGLLQSLIERHRLHLRRDRDQVKRDEIELNLVNRSLTVLNPVAGLSSLAEILTGARDEAREGACALATTRAMVKRITPLAAHAALLAQHEAELGKPIEVPVCKDTAPLARLVSRLQHSGRIASLPDVPSLVAVPCLSDTARLRTLGRALTHGLHAERLASAMREAPVAPEMADTGKLQNVANRIQHGRHAVALLARLPNLTSAPQLTETSGLRKAGIALAQRTAELASLAKDEKTVLAEEQTAQTALHDLKHTLGVCPVCNQAFK